MLTLNVVVDAYNDSISEESFASLDVVRNDCEFISLGYDGL